MKKEDYVSLEVAKLLKEKGFNNPCIYFYCEMHDCIENTLSNSCRFKKVTYKELEDGDLLIPTLYEAVKWLWEKYKLLVMSFLDEPFVEPYVFLWSVQDAKKRNR